jgi:hypothetical protein
MMELAEIIFPILLAALGTWLLVREVAKGHKFEEMSRELTQRREDMSIAKEMADLYATDRREFWIRCQMDAYRQSRESIEKMFGDIPVESIETQTEEFKDLWQEEAPRAIARFEKTRKVFDDLFAPTQLRQRRRLLWLGFSLIMLSAVLQIAVVVSNASSASMSNTTLEAKPLALAPQSTG